MNTDTEQERQSAPGPPASRPGPQGARGAPLNDSNPQAGGTGIQGLQPQDYIPRHLAAALYGAALLQSSITAWWR
eukprot:8154165-Lingulodinium_polyedra.AAC.1